eukprot:TRINITY_DN15739_c0_g1_i1.p1 TRINITY_DN15739_c0_g1~~TRINITY_DN15739_c0_g1_i1.p1  ORF type:complete len:343 (-),score=37.61 TRINITY_DN15739_c0_g1_i1:42-1070(-)
MYEMDGELANSKPILHPRCSVTIHHPQLCNLLQCDRKRQLFFVSDTAIKQYCPASSTLSVVRKLPFSPTCIAAGAGLVAVGGRLSELHVDDLVANRAIFSQTIGSCIVNAVCISEDRNPAKLLVCNNDCSIKIYDPLGMSLVTQIRSPVPVNCCATSPDGKWMAHAGDSAYVFLCDVERDYERVSTFLGGRDVGMSVSFDPLSNLFASANQDGSLNLFDIRSRTMIQSMPTANYVFSSQSMGMMSRRAACRCVKFLPRAPMDMLAYTSHTNVCGVVDLRMMAIVQILRMETEGTLIAGMAFQHDGSRLFVGTESSVCEYEVSTTARRGSSSCEMMGTSVAVS